jgi:hypothetical protein
MRWDVFVQDQPSRRGDPPTTSLMPAFDSSSRSAAPQQPASTTELPAVSTADFRAEDRNARLVRKFSPYAPRVSTATARNRRLPP